MLPADCGHRYRHSRDSARQNRYWLHVRDPRLKRCTAIVRALECYRDRKTWRQIQRSGMRRDFSWNNSAAQYLALYRSLLGEK
jgi:hypothetical protein